MKWLACAYAWVKHNDLPNTFTFVVTFILWPLAVLWWNTRKVNSISNLIVAYMPGHHPVAIGQAKYPSVEILFENQTGSIVYIRGPRIRNCSARFPVPITAVKDTGENAYPLSFLNPASGRYEGHQITLQTNRDTVYEAIKVFEEADILTWVNRIARIKVQELDLFGHRVWRWQTIRTSNAYIFRDPLPCAPQQEGYKSENPSGTQNLDISKKEPPVQYVILDRSKPLDALMIGIGERNGALAAAINLSS